MSKSCQHCGTPLEFEVTGQRVRFTAHDDAFCRLATQERVQLLLRSLDSQREAFERTLRDLRRSVDRILAEARLPSLDDRARDAQITASIMRHDLIGAV